MMSLLLVLVGKGPLRIIAGGVGFPAFGLSLVRSDWAGWALGALFIAAYVGGKTRLRLIFLGFGVVLIAYPLVTIGPVADQLQKRFASFSNIQQDGSYQQRQNLYDTITVAALSYPVGTGFGTNGSSTKLGNAEDAGFDSGVLQIPYLFGWVFGSLFVCAIFMLVARMIAAARVTTDAVSIAGAAIFLAMLLQNIGAPSFTDVPGFVTWLGAAIVLGPAMAAQSGKSARRGAAPRRALVVPGMLHEN